MAHILKRLREVNGGWVPDMALEAADEIERLRESMVMIANIEDEMWGSFLDEIERARHIARAALEENK